MQCSAKQARFSMLLISPSCCSIWLSSRSRASGCSSARQIANTATRPLHMRHISSVHVFSKNLKYFLFARAFWLSCSQCVLCVFILVFATRYILLIYWSRHLVDWLTDSSRLFPRAQSTMNTWFQAKFRWNRCSTVSAVMLPDVGNSCVSKLCRYEAKSKGTETRFLDTSGHWSSILVVSITHKVRLLISVTFCLGRTTIEI